MGGFRKKMEIGKDRVEGVVKVKVGKATGNKKMALEGKAHGLAATLKEKMLAFKK